MNLGVNIDHIAVLREARLINDPDPLDALSIVKRAGGDQITIHLREDRRHINDEDAKAIIQHSHLPVNLECSIKMIDIAQKLNPYRITLVPENRKEVTTEGGLDLKGNFKKIQNVIKKANDADIEVSLFIDPNEESINLSTQLKTQWVELHTGFFSNVYAMLFSNISKTAHSVKELEFSRKKLKSLHVKSIKDLAKASKQANSNNLKVAAGHGLNYQNVKEITKIPYIEELNIGQSIVARSIFVGLENAIKQMKESF